MFERSHRLVSFVILLLLVVVHEPLSAQDQLQDVHSPVQDEEIKLDIPTLSEIIPLAIGLSGRLDKLKIEMDDLLDIAELEADYIDFCTDLEQPAGQIQHFRENGDLRYNELFELKKSLDIYIESFETISAPLLQAIEQTGSWQKEWMQEKDQWAFWKDTILGEGGLPQLELTFTGSNSTIDSALNLIIPQLGALFELQHEGYKNKTKLDAYEAEVDGMIRNYHQTLLVTPSKSMLSSEFSSQLTSGTWQNIKKGFSTIAWPDTDFLKREIWILILQLLISLLVIIFILWKRHRIAEIRSYAFVARHPIAAGLFLGTMSTIVTYQLHNAPNSWSMIMALIGGFSFARLASSIEKSSWKSFFIYGVILLLIITQLLDLMSFPLPLYRIFLLLVAAICFISCLRWAGKSRHTKVNRHHRWWLYLISIVSLAIFIVEIAGDHSLANYIFASMVRTVISLLIFLMLMYLIRGAVEQFFHSAGHDTAGTSKTEVEPKVKQIVTFINTVLVIFVLLPSTLAIWGAYDNLQEANTGLMNLGFSLGSLRITVGLFLTVAGILYGAYILSVIIQYLITNRIMSQRHIDKGARLSINRLLHYFILFMGFILAISALGLEVTKLTIILSALGVGVGFGLQGVVNNFVSGLILLIERPIREGDSIQVAGEWSTISKIGLRATRVKTVDEADVIIPNADLVYNQVTNWTLGNRAVKVILPVGVSYGSDVDLVIETLIAATEASTNIVKEAGTQALFMGFGESSLNFELRLWVSDARERIQVISDLHRDIFRRFKEENIEIAFPQMDLHLPDVDQSIIFDKKNSDK